MPGPLTVWPDLGYGVKIAPHRWSKEPDPPDASRKAPVGLRYLVESPNIRPAPLAVESWHFELKRCRERDGSPLWDFAGPGSDSGTPDFEDGLIVAKGWIYQRRLMEIRVDDACFEGAEDIAQFGAALLRVNDLAEELRRGAA